MASIFRKSKKVLYSDSENRVRNATKNNEFYPSEGVCRQIAADTFNVQLYEKMYAVLMRRLQDRQYPVHVLKALNLIEYLVSNADLRFVRDIRRDQRVIDKLQ
eukprot:497549_1